MAVFIAALVETLQSPRVGEALSGVFGSVSLTAWICLLVRHWHWHWHNRDGAIESGIWVLTSTTAASTAYREL